jgi:hypothetical protein
MSLTKTEKRLLVDMFKSAEGLFIFTLYKRFNLSPKELFIAIESLKKEGLINSENERLNITKLGIEFIVTNGLKPKGSSKKFVSIPLEFLGPKIGINEFYIPKWHIESNENINL